MTSSYTARFSGIETSVAMKAAVVAATTANITLSGAQTIDAVAVVADDRVLVKDQTDGTENGIYVASTGAWSRATDFDGVGDVVKGTSVLVNGGTVGAGTLWSLQTADVTFGTTSVSFSQVAYIASSFAQLSDDTTPQLGGPLDANSHQVNWSKGADVASATALTLGADGNYFDITGTTAITSIVTRGIGTVVMLQFDAALTLTHHATDLILPGGANITTAAGDHAQFVEYATGDWRCVSYQKAAAVPPDDTATAAEYRDNTAAKLIDTDAAWGAMAEVTLTDAANISWDMDTGIDYTVTLGGNRTLDNATNTQVGKKGRIRVVQDGTGSRTLAFGTSYEFAGGTAPTLTTTAAAEDVLYYDCISATRILISSILDIS